MIFYLITPLINRIIGRYLDYKKGLIATALININKELNYL